MIKVQKIHKVSFLFILLLIINAFANFQLSQAQSTVKPKLPDLQVLGAERYPGWAGSGLGLTLEVDEFRQLPLDADEQYNGMAALRITATGAIDSGGWWQGLLAGKDWETYSIAPYMQNGSIEFAVKGANGGERFMLSLNDSVPGRDPANAATVEVNVSEFGTVTNEWQKISIPLARFTPEDGETFNHEQMFTIGISGADTSPVAFWIADIRFVSPDLQPSYPAIKVNQLGYRPDGLKQVFVSGFADELPINVNDKFTLKNASTKDVVYEGTLRLVAELDRSTSGERVFEADFSAFIQPGVYVISAGDGQLPDSEPFKIDDNVYAPLVSDTMRYFYLQRAGIELRPEHAGAFARPIGHPQDLQAAFRSGTFPPRDVSGGWYDAGDYGKYVNAGATAVSDLLWAYEMFPDQFPDSHLTIPESGNGVSDLLDEVRWELDWIMKMQDPTSGGFYHMVQPTEQASPHDSIETRYIEDSLWGQGDVKPSAGSGSATAVLAHAAYVFRDIDPDYADQLQASAELGYKYLEDNLELVSPVEGPYDDWDDSENRFWAATSLYRLTGDDKYHATIRSLYSFINTTFESTTDNGYGVQSMGMVAWLPYIYSENQDPIVTDFFRQEFTGWSNHMTKRWNNSIWNHTLLDEDYYWGSNYVALTTPLVLYIGHRALGEDITTAKQISQQGLDYLLGSNPLSLSYVSGYGANSIRNLHSATWSYDQVERVPPGVMAGGPNQYNNPLVHTSFPGKWFLDSTTVWTMNEHTVYWNSVLVFHAAMQATQANPAIVDATAAPAPEPTIDPSTEAEPETEEATEIAEAPVEEGSEAGSAVAEEADIENGPEAESTLEEEANVAVGEDEVSEDTGESNMTWLIILAAVGGAILTLLLIAVGFFIGRNR